MLLGIGIGLGFQQTLGSVIPPNGVSGLLAWYESDSGFVLDASGNLQTWLDKSGNNFDLTQATPSSRPAVVGNSFNGFAAASFVNGQTKFLSGTSNFAGGAHTIIAVIKPRALGSVFAGALTLGSVTTGFQSSTVGIDSLGRLWYGGNSFGAVNPVPPVNGTLHVIGKTSNGTATRIFEEGSFTQASTEGAPVAPTPATDILCGIYYSGGNNDSFDVIAMCAFSRALTDDEIKSVERYFVAKYTAPVFTPASVPGILGWYESDFGIGLNGSNVAQWLDKSGNGAHLAQASAGFQPAFNPSSLNGFPAIAFTDAAAGAGKGLAGTTTYAGGPTGRFSIFAVYKPRTSSTNFGAAVALGNAPAGGSTSVCGTNNVTQLWPGGAGYGSGENFFFTPGSVYVYGHTYDGATHTQTFLNGVARSLITQPLSINISAPTAILCGPYYGTAPAQYTNSSMDVLAICAYDNQLSSADAIRVQQYFMDKYGLRTAFLPSNLPNLALWAKADAGVTLNGSNVANWADQSGNGRDWIQATPGAQPIFTANSTNGLPTLDFDGARNMIAAAATVFTQPTTVFLVGRYSAAVANQYFLDDTTLNKLVFQNFGGNFRAYAGALIDAGAQVINNVYVMSAVFNGVSSIAALNGNEVPGNVGGGIATGLTLGSAAGGILGLTGSIPEVIIYRGVLSALDRANVSRYLAARYGLRVAARPDGISGLVSWHRADLGITLNGGAVANWADQSGNGYDYAQGNPTYQPTYNAASGTFNSKSTVQFNGAQVLHSLPQNISGVKTVILVYRLVSVPTLGSGSYVMRILRNLAASLYSTHVIANAIGGYQNLTFKDDYAAGGATVGAPLTVDTSIHVVETSYDATANTAPTAYTDANDAVSKTVGISGAFGSPATLRASLGGIADSTGAALAGSSVSEIAEMMVYNRVLTPVDRGMLRTYLAARYGVSLP